MVKDEGPEVWGGRVIVYSWSTVRMKLNIFFCKKVGIKLSVNDVFGYLQLRGSCLVDDMAISWR